MANDADVLSTQDIDQVLEIWSSGGCVAMPTETVYGLAADATNGQAVAKIFALKNRPSFNPLIVHLYSDSAAEKLVEWTDLCSKLFNAFMPGALTLIRPKLDNCMASDLCSAGGGTLAVRCPAHPVARQLLRAYGKPVAAPSANRSGRISPTRPEHVRSEFADALHVVDGGACSQGIESTVLWVGDAHVEILRPGSITLEDLQGQGIEVHEHVSAHAGASPGQLTSHYAPTLPVRLNATQANEGEVLLGFGEVQGKLNLSASGDLTEAAANLFAYLRELDASEAQGIALAPIPESGLGVAINDRLRRAAAPRG